MKYFIGIMLIIIFTLTGISDYYFGQNNGYHQGIDHELAVSNKRLSSIQKAARNQQSTIDKNNQDNLLLSLRVCITEAPTILFAQTDCFRDVYQGIITKPTVQELNRLPDLY